MKKIITLLAALAALLASSAAIAETAGIDISKTGFNPKDVTVEAGSAVSWKNSDTIEHAVVVDKTTCKLALQPQQSSSCPFPTPGTFAYSDPTTKDKAFAGTITVAPAVQRSVTIAANRNIAIFGDSVTLSGTTSAKKAGETVTVYVRPAGEPVSASTSRPRRTEPGRCACSRASRPSTRSSTAPRRAPSSSSPSAHGSPSRRSAQTSS